MRVGSLTSKRRWRRCVCLCEFVGGERVFGRWWLLLVAVLVLVLVVLVVVVVEVVLVVVVVLVLVVVLLVVVVVGVLVLVHWFYLSRVVLRCTLR